MENIILKINVEATGTQKILCPANSDITFAGYGGAVLYSTGFNWRVISYSNS